MPCALFFRTIPKGLQSGHPDVALTTGDTVAAHIGTFFIIAAVHIDITGAGLYTNNKQ